MLETLKSIILDFQEVALETGVPRHLVAEALPGKASICIGVRRSGKTTYLYQVMERLITAGVPRENLLYVNFFDDRLRALRREGLGRITEAYFSLYPEKKGTEKVYFFFDEIQAAAEWEPFVDRLLRTERCEIWLTGSSAQMLSREIATEMRGRALTWEIFPFSFAEYLHSVGIDHAGPRSTRQRLRVQKAFEGYWTSGGFPEVVGLQPHLRVKVHQEYLRAVLFRDLVDRYDIAHPRAVSDLAHWLLENTASLYSINRLTGYLQSLGHRAPKAAVSDYLAWFEDAFFLFTVRILDASVARSRTNPKKIYCVDHALVTSVTSGILSNAGHLLENLVFSALRRVSPEIHYVKTRRNREVDFAARMPDGRWSLVQVCETLADLRTRAREIAALGEAMAELGLRQATLVTRGEPERIRVDAGDIEVMPAWHFLLLTESGDLP
jgi:predicted AAA+ superfamily ATPase